MSERSSDPLVVFLLESRGYDADQYVIGIFATLEAAQRVPAGPDIAWKHKGDEWWEPGDIISGGKKVITRMEVKR